MLEILDYTDAATEGALLGLWREVDGPNAQVELSSAGTSRGHVWRLLSTSRHWVADGPTPALTVARALCALGLDGICTEESCAYTQEDADEFKAAVRRAGPK